MREEEEREPGIDQPGVAGVLGPATRPTPQDFGIVAAARSDLWRVAPLVLLAALAPVDALGSDYKIFLVGRIWSEAERRPINDAIIAAGTGASQAITAAGLVLSASFAVLALVPVEAFQQLAFAPATGLLIDAFLVRTVHTPAVIALVGERSSWPGNRLAAPTRTRVPGPSASPLRPAGGGRA